MGEPDSDNPKMMMSGLLLLLIPLGTASLPGPYQGKGIKRIPGNPSCVSFTLQDDLPPESVQIITYGAPEFSTVLAMSLEGDQKTFPVPGQKVTVHYALYLDDCSFIESSRDDGTPFTYTMGEDRLIEGWERGIPQMSLGQRVSMTLSPDMGYGEEGAGDGVIPPNAVLVFDIEILNIE